jgi:acyl dehydratase
MTDVRTIEGTGVGLTSMVKAALPVLPVVNQLPGVRKSGSTLPDVVVKRTAAVERDHVAAYAAVCGFPVKDTAPLTFLHLLAFPLHLALMTDRAFPFPAIGTVHLENAITQLRPVPVGSRVGLSARATNLRSHPKGKVFDIEVEVTASGDTIWTSTSTYLRVGTGDKSADPGRTFSAVPSGGIPWRLPADLGRRYAGVSGDHNPIHLYPLTAKAFGFRRQIAHGMWSKARCVAALENRLPDAVTVEVGFRKPVFLPGTVAFGMRQVGADFEFSLADPKSGAPHLLGRTTSI